MKMYTKVTCLTPTLDARLTAGPVWPIRHDKPIATIVTTRRTHNQSVVHSADIGKVSRGSQDPERYFYIVLYTKGAGHQSPAGLVSQR